MFFHQDGRKLAQDTQPANVQLNINCSRRFQATTED
jgi:hypothetical protein